MKKFQDQTSDKGRFMIARNIIEISIDPEASFTLNISYQTRSNVLEKMKYYEQKFLEKEAFLISTDFFKDVSMEIHRLIMENHWIKFRKAMKNMNHDG